MKKILYGNEARKLIKQGIDTCANVVKVSMGSGGKNVLIFNGSSTEIINDGVTIARAINIKDPIQQAGIQLAKQCAIKTNEDAGDGTTTTIVLLQAFLDEIIKDIQLENPRQIREDLKQEIETILTKIEVKQIKNKKDVYNLALTSSLNPNVSQIIADIYKELGRSAKISIEETSKNTLAKEIIKGIKFDSINPNKLSEENKTLNDCGLIVKENIENFNELAIDLKKHFENGLKSVVIISNSFSHSALVSISGFRDLNLVPIEYKMLAGIDDLKLYGDKCEKVIINKETTTIIGGNGNTDEKVRELELELKKEESNFQKELLENRIANLKGSVAVIKVGGNTDVERQEIYLKVEDAVNCVKGAYDLGYCVGGGKALKEASKGTKLEAICSKPYEQIKENLGYEPNLDGVIDSFKTIKHSLLNSFSTATSILTTESALIEELDENDD